jgi:Transglycosylase SLT domain
MGFTRPLFIASLVCTAIAAYATAGERPAQAGKGHTGRHATAHDPEGVADPLDRIADAVDGVESSHGKDVAMWRPDPAAPQGPMQVSEAAATDIGGGDRFDLAQNRALGRAYLSRMYWRYRNWPDAIAAYNWGIGKMDSWVKAGRSQDQFLIGVAAYQQRVLHDSGLCNDTENADPGQMASSATKVDLKRQRVASHSETLVAAACTAPDPATGALVLTTVTNRFYKQLEAALQLAVRRAAQDR